MSTFARNDNGRLTDVCYGASVEAAVESSFAAGYVAGKKWVRVPDGAVSNSTITSTDDQGNVTGFTPPPAAPRAPKSLSKTAFQDLCVAAFGGGTTGMARFQDIMDAAEASTGAVKFCFSRYGAADFFAKNQVKDFTDIMVAATIMNLGEQTSVIDSWPME